MSQAEPTRPDPDALAELAAREGRGSLKIFLGAAPGVGKTVEMLTEGRTLLQAGRDVLIGVVETHGRADTELAIGPLPRLPPRAIAYRGQVLQEFDLEAALVRRPDVLLLDELAHSNAPGSRHPKRWQDVEELRDAGIEVWTTMNVQHLESSAEAVARVTGVRVAETVPDAVLKGADAVELVDIPPAELLERMRAGKIYRPEQAERAMRGFFKEGALGALRELALRRTADRVDADVTSWMRRNAVAGPWPVGDRVLALVPGGPGAEPILQQARRLADALHAPLLALHVEQPGVDGEPGPGLALAQQLGAETEVTTASDLPAAILAHARARRASHIILGRGQPPWWRRVLGRTLIAALARAAPEFTLHVVPDQAAAPATTPARSLPGWTSWLMVAGLIAGTTALCMALDGMVPDAAFGMVYLAAIVAIAAVAGPLHAGAGAVLGFLAWNFLFLPPRYTLAIASAQDVLGAVVFGAVAALLAGTTGRLGRNVRSAATRLAALRRLTALSRRLSAQASMGELQQAVVEEAGRIVGGPACLLLPFDDALAAALPEQFRTDAMTQAEPVLRAASPAEAAPDDGAMAAARWALANGRAAGRGTATLPASNWRFLPLTAMREGGPVTLGLLGLRPEADTPDPEADRALEALLDQAAVALERARLADVAANARARGQAEALRTALLTSLGHDLRTPLLRLRNQLDQVGQVEGAAERAIALGDELLRLFGAILRISEVEGGGLARDFVAVDLSALALAVGESFEAAIVDGGRGFAIEVAPGISLAGHRELLAQALANLLDNAVVHTPVGTQITLRLAVEAEGAELAVADDGPGVAAEEVARLTRRFYRSSASRTTPGNGLGLSLVQAVAELHGGQLHLDGARGFVATLRLPRR